MIINMTTFAGRQKHYLDRTLESLFNSEGGDLQVNLMMGSYDTSHVEKYREVKNIGVVEWDEAAQLRAREGNLRRNCSVNAFRALRYGDSDLCLCCEDDIHFLPNWYSELRATIADIPGDNYLLNLGQGSDLLPVKRYTLHTDAYLCGAQAIFYPNKAIRKAVAKYLLANLRAALSDDLIGRYAKKFAALYNTTPALVWHIGQVSSLSD
jgi:hypothetical protein